jgi:group I intron endonuclease
MMQKNNMYCYIITNTINGKQYIGIAVDPKRRWVEHRCGHGSKVLYSAFKKYGRESFRFNILCEGDGQQIKDTEIRLISFFDTVAPSGYNLTVGGEGSTGWRPTKETKEKWSLARRGVGNAMFGKTHSEETKKKLTDKAKQRIPTLECLKRLQTISQGSKNRHARPIEINGIRYDYIGEAASALNLKASTLRTYVGRFERENRWPRTLQHLTIKLL